MTTVDETHLGRFLLLCLRRGGIRRTLNHLILYRLQCLSNLQNNSSEVSTKRIPSDIFLCLYIQFTSNALLECIAFLFECFSNLKEETKWVTMSAARGLSDLPLCLYVIFTSCTIPGYISNLFQCLPDQTFLSSVRMKSVSVPERPARRHWWSVLKHFLDILMLPCLLPLHE